MSNDKNFDKREFYDSGRADSGFLSGALTSGEIGNDEPTTTSTTKGTSTPTTMSVSGGLNVDPMDKNKDDYMRLDSGVDVGFSDLMSDLCIDDEPSVDSLGPPVVLPPPETNVDEFSWQLYFQQDDEGDTQLHIAIIHGFIEVVFNLIRMVPRPEYLNIHNDMRQTALHLAVLTRQPRILRRLIVAGADPGNVDRNGNTPLHLATYTGDALCVRALTECVAPHEIAAAQLRYVPSCPRKIPSLADMSNYDGLTAVHLAALSNHFGILKHLVKCGADIDARERKAGRTVLHMAAEVGNDSLAVLALRDLMADPEMPNYAGLTAYHVGRRNPQILRILLAHGAFADPDYYSSDDEDDDDIQSYGNGFKDLAQGQIINAS